MSDATRQLFLPEAGPLSMPAGRGEDEVHRRSLPFVDEVVIRGQVADAVAAVAAAHRHTDRGHAVVRGPARSS